jgi:hypothetical protein
MPYRKCHLPMPLPRAMTVRPPVPRRPRRWPGNDRPNRRRGGTRAGRACEQSRSYLAWACTRPMATDAEGSEIAARRAMEPTGARSS